MKRILYKGVIGVFMLLSTGILAQKKLVGTLGHEKQTKTYKETFNVNKDAVLDINTSNADIEFETWSKDQIQIETVLEIEGMSAKEAEEYFERNEVKVIGNSKKVEVSTASGGLFSHHNFALGSNHHTFNHRKSHPTVIHSQSAHFPKNITLKSDSLYFNVAPLVSAVSVPKFDYKVYKKDGKKYLTKWQKKFEKEFDEKKVKELEEWAKKMEKNALVMEKKAEALAKKHEALTKRHKELAKRNEKIYVERAKILAVRAKALHKRNGQNIIIADSITSKAPNIFYFSSDGEDKHIKVKKTIKIKMPKSATIKMNVRHGEVKLAESTNNLDANLSYASLHAITIDGKDTNIAAVYSPISVARWNVGQLRADYADQVELKVVRDLKLSSISSNVEIHELLKTAFVQNDFGKVIINNISRDFAALDITLKNGELDCNLPKSSYRVYIKGTSSKLTTPASLALSKTKNQNTIVHKGYNGSKTTDKSINIDSKYSEVALRE